MAAPLSQVFYPSGFQELFSAWARFPDAVPFAGGTGLMRYQGKRIPVLPRNIISLDKLDELRRISRTERYLEIGSMVKLNQIIQLGKIVPEVLTQCLENVAGSQLRNLATIGGNICYHSRRLDCSAPLVALDAQYELRSAQSSRWIAASRFAPFHGPQALAPQELLTRIRVPLDPWAFTCYRKFHTEGTCEPGGAILFIMKNQKDILTDIRVVYSGQTILREKNSETMLSGKHLPLDRKDAMAFVERWKTFLSGIEVNEHLALPGNSGRFNPELLKVQIISFIETTIMRIAD
ncbi:MAG: FAD binding domain-containing protein [Treponema sp.]|nr:FAD binding domain-containing protein [Treponema sp.]